jgi:hypothetical protein
VYYGEVIGTRVCYSTGEEISVRVVRYVLVAILSVRVVGSTRRLVLSVRVYVVVLVFLSRYTS